MEPIDFSTKEMMIKLAGTCFWFWKTFYSFLDSCGIPSSLYLQIGKESGKYQVMRSLLGLLERKGKYALINDIARQLYNLTPIDDNINREIANKFLEEFRNKIGKSILQREINNIEEKKRISEQKRITEENRLYTDIISQLKNKFLSLLSSTDRQQRGYAIEKLFFNLLQVEEFEYKQPYKTSNGEQIDGYFKYDKFDYLVEIKWTEEPSSQADISIFDGKIRGKAQSTRGFFLSINGFSESSITKYSGDSPRIICMNGEDLLSILEERITFFDLMKFKADNLVRKGNIYMSYKKSLA